MTSRGVYGLRVDGLDDAERWLAEVPGDWPRLSVECVAGEHPHPKPPGTIRLSDTAAELWLAEAGWAELRRQPLSLRFTTRHELSTDALLHPFLGLPAAIANGWLGRLALHGGGFIHAGRAWMLLGVREAGKSATLAGLLDRGAAILSDDILIVEGTRLFAGPQSIDLRPDAAAAIGGEPLGVVGRRERWRVRPPRPPAAAPLGGYVWLEWGQDTRLEALGAEDRLGRLIASCALSPRPDQAPALLELAALPAWRFVRSPRLDELPGQVDQLLAGLGA